MHLNRELTITLLCVFFTAPLMPSTQVSQILSYTAKLMPINCKSKKLAQFVLKVVQTISEPDDCQTIWSLKESQDLIEVLFDTLFNEDAYEKGMCIVLCVLYDYVSLSIIQTIF